MNRYVLLIHSEQEPEDFKTWVRHLMRQMPKYYPEAIDEYFVLTGKDLDDQKVAE